MADYVPAAKAVPLTCIGHSRPITHLDFSSSWENDDTYYLISGAKDNEPQLLHGVTGDWVGHFVNHQGAVWSAKLSDNASLAATASGDFSAKVWDATTGKELQALPHNHIVRSVAFAPGPSPGMVATAGYEKKLRVWDLKEPSGDVVANYEIGAGVHTGHIKSVVWTPESDLLVTAAEDNAVRWWDMRQQKPVNTFAVDGALGSLELTTKTADSILSVASGSKVYFFTHSGRLLKTHTLPYVVSCVAIHWEQKKFITGCRDDTWIRIYDYESGNELLIRKGHHGPVWSVTFSPDGKLYATGSEDGTIKLWKFTKEAYGMWKDAE